MDNRAEQIAAIVSKAEPGTHSRYRAACRYSLMGTDGKWYSGLGGFPIGVKFAGEKKEYWVAQCRREGTTHGTRYSTSGELLAAWASNDARKREELAAELAAMNDADFAQSVEYWLGKA